MNRFECPREQDVLDAIAARRWPARCDGELRDHVASCALCADLVAVAGALLDADGDESTAGELPPASLVWWRAQLRAREEAARAALRPIRLAQRLALGCAVGLAVLALSGASPYVWTSIAGAVAHLPSIDAGAARDRVLAGVSTFDATAATRAALTALAGRGVQLAAAAWLVLAPVAIYLAFARD